ncbi:MAG: tRNA-intron endonuclease family protein [Acidilobus sp.]
MAEGQEEAYERAFSAVKDRGDWPEALNTIGSLGLDFELFLVYYDLRRRGRRVALGRRPRTLLVEERPSRIAEVLVLSEGRPVKPSEIAEWSRLAVSDSHEPVLAIVDESGIITYYEARVVTDLT